MAVSLAERRHLGILSTRRTRRSLGDYPGALIAGLGLVVIGGASASAAYVVFQLGKHKEPKSNPPKNEPLDQPQETPDHVQATKLAQKLISDPKSKEWRGNVVNAQIYVHKNLVDGEVVTERGIVIRTKPVLYAKSAPQWTWFHPALNPDISWQVEVEVETKGFDIDTGKFVTNKIRYAVLENIKRTPPAGEKPLDPDDFPLFAAISWKTIDDSNPNSPQETLDTFVIRKDQNLPEPFKFDWPELGLTNQLPTVNL